MFDRDICSTETFVVKGLLLGRRRNLAFDQGGGRALLGEGSGEAFVRCSVWPFVQVVLPPSK